MRQRMERLMKTIRRRMPEDKQITEPPPTRLGDASCYKVGFNQPENLATDTIYEIPVVNC